LGSRKAEKKVMDLRVYDFSTAEITKGSG